MGTTASYYGGPYVLNDTVIYTQNGNSFGAIDLKTGNWHGMQFGLTTKLPPPIPTVITAATTVWARSI